MNPQSEVILRQDRYLSGKILLINPPCDELQDYLQVESVEIWTWNYADFQYFIRDQQTNVHFGIECPQGEFDQAIIFVPKAKELLNYVLEQTAAALGKDKDIFLVGEKKAGIERAAKQLQPYGKVVKLDSARHCQMWQLNNASTVTKQALAAWTKSYLCQLDEIELEICALPGVFSQDHLDTGTQQILPFLAQVRSKKILDFGCGAGIIAATLAIQNNQRQITAVDIDAFALKSTELTFEKNGLSAQLTLQAITDITDLSQRFNAIVSNPPFHQGIKTHYQASENLFKFAAAHLQSKGELWIVANRFLNYAPLIEQQFGHCLIKADQKGFKVLFAKK